MTAEEILSWRERLGLTQEDAARALGVPVATYRNWEWRRRKIPPPIPVLARYVERFGLEEA